MTSTFFFGGAAGIARAAGCGGAVFGCFAFFVAIVRLFHQWKVSDGTRYNGSAASTGLDVERAADDPGAIGHRVHAYPLAAKFPV